MIIAKISGFNPARGQKVVQSFGKRKSCIEDTLMIKAYLNELSNILGNYERTSESLKYFSDNDSNTKRIADEMIPYIKSRQETLVRMYKVTEKKDIGENTDYIRQYILADKEMLRLQTEITKNKYEISKYHISDIRRKNFEERRNRLEKELEPFKKWEKQLREKIFNS